MSHRPCQEILGLQSGSPTTPVSVLQHPVHIQIQNFSVTAWRCGGHGDITGLRSEAAPPEFEKTFGAGADVGFGVVGAAVRAAEQVVVELGEFGPLEAPTVHLRQGTELRAAFHGAEGGERRKVFRMPEASVFVKDDGAVKRDVMADIQAGGVTHDVGLQSREGFNQWNAAAAGGFCRDAVDGGGTRRDGEAVRANDAVDGGGFLAAVIVERPADGNDAVLGSYAGGFGVEDEVHRRLRLSSLHSALVGV